MFNREEKKPSGWDQIINNGIQIEEHFDYRHALPNSIKPSDKENEISEYTQAIVSGAINGTKHFIDTVLHPFDKLIVPTVNTIVDGGIITHFSTSAEKPSVYYDAATRAKEYVSSIEKSVTTFLDAPGPKKVETATELAITSLLPSLSINGIKAIKNYRQFDSFNPPPLYHNTIHDLIDPSPPITFLKLNDIKELVGEKSLLYVLDKKRNLLIASRDYPKPLFRNGKETNQIHHPEMAQPVYAAGELKTFNGKLEQINNFSGHFRPRYNDSLVFLVEKSFIKEGFENVLGKFQDSTTLVKLPPCITHETINFHPSHILAELFFSLNSEHQPSNSSSVQIPINEQIDKFSYDLRIEKVTISQDKPKNIYKTRENTMSNTSISKNDDSANKKVNNSAHHYDQNQIEEKMKCYIAEFHDDIKEILKHQHAEKAAKAFDAKLQNINHGFSILSNAALLSGNNKLANRLAVTGGALTSVGQVVAGLNGVGLLAGINPFAAGAMIFASLTSIIGVFGSHDDNSMQVLYEAIQAISYQLNIIRQEMHERFNQIMETLDDLGKKIFLAFCNVDNNQQLVMLNIKQLHDELADLKKSHQYGQATSLSYLKQISQEQTNSKIINKTFEIVRTVEDAKDYIVRSKDHLLAFEDKLNHVFTLINGSTGCKSSDATGQEITDDIRTSNPDALIHLLNAYQWPMLPIRTLSAYQKDLKLPNDYYYSHDQLDYLMNRMRSEMEKNDTQTEISSTHFLSHLLVNEKKDQEDTYSSLSKTLTKFLSLENKKRLLVPLLIHGEYSLLVIETKPTRFYYFGNDSKSLERIKTIINETTKVISQIEEPFNEDTDHIEMPHSLSSQQSAVWILGLAKKLLQNPEDKIISIKENEDLQKVITLSVEDLQNQHATWQTQLTEAPTPFISPVNPILYNVATQQYLNSFKKLIDPSNQETSYAGICYSDIEHFQRLLNDAEHAHQLIMRTRNVKLFETLIANYSAATQSLSNELNKHLNDFEERESGKINLSVTEKLQQSHRKNLYDKLINQDISIKADYPCNLKFNASIAVRDWGRTRQNEQIVVSKWHTGYTDPLYDYTTPCPGDPSNNLQQANTYINNRKLYIKNYIYQYIQQNNLEKLLKHQNRLHIFNKDELATRSTPCAITPSKQGPLTFSNPSFVDFIPDEVFIAQARGLGEIVFTYSRGLADIIPSQVKGGDFAINIFFFNYRTEELMLVPTRKRTTYDPLFYTGDEAIWWAVVGGECALDANALTAHRHVPAAWAYPSWCYLPNMKKRIGLIDQPQNMIETIDKASDTYMNAISQFKTLIAEDKCRSQKNWQEEVQHILETDTKSPLGSAYARYVASFKLLQAFIEVALPLHQRGRMLNILQSLLSINHDKRFFAGDGLLHLLEHDLNEPLSHYLPSLSQFKELQFILTETIKLQSRNTDYVLFDEIEEQILSYLDTQMPNVKREHTTNLQNQEHDRKLFQQSLVSWASVNPNDVEAVKKMQAQMTMALLYMNQQALPSATSSNQIEDTKLETLFSLPTHLSGNPIQSIEPAPLTVVANQSDIKNALSQNSIFNNQKIIDKHWYDDDEMELLLSHYLKDIPEVDYLHGIDIYQHGGFTLAENLEANQLQQALQLSLGNPINTIVMPLNLGSKHWAALYIYCDSKNNGKMTIQYIDPLGDGMPTEVINALAANYPNVPIEVSAKILQKDGYNCGPWTITILESLVKTNQLPPQNFDINKRRQEDVEIVKVQKMVWNRRDHCIS